MSRLTPSHSSKSKNLNLPSIVGVKNATSLIRENDDIIIDSTLDSILINTDKNIKSFYVKKLKLFTLI